MLKKLFYGTAAILLLAGCSASQMAKTRAADLMAPGLAAGGGAIGFMATEGKSDGTRLAAAGAGLVGGYLIGQYINNGFQDDKLEEFKTGYDLGRSNSTKQLYWMYQDLNRAKEGTMKYQLYTVPAAYPNDGVKRVDSNITIPIVRD